jgi:hypothetical protein
MPGTVTIVAVRPGFGRAGRIKVSVDGAVVAKLRQGSSLDLTLAPGEHRFRVSAGGSRSRAVTLVVAEGGHQYLSAGVHDGLAVAAVVGGAILGVLGGLVVVLPVAVALLVAPGAWFYLRPSESLRSSDALEDAEEAAVAESGEPWWVTDPNLAKRYRKD